MNERKERGAGAPGRMPFFRSYYEAVRLLPDDSRLRMYDAICAYYFTGEVGEMTAIETSLFTLLKPNLDSSLRRGQASRGNGQTGGRPGESQAAPEETCAEPTQNPTGTYEEPDENLSETCAEPTQNPAETYAEPNRAFSPGVRSMEREEEKEKEMEMEMDMDTDDGERTGEQETELSFLPPQAPAKTKKFVPPDVSEVRKYVREHGYSVDAEQFCDFYEVPRGVAPFP